MLLSKAPAPARAAFLPAAARYTRFNVPVTPTLGGLGINWAGIAAAAAGAMAPSAGGSGGAGAPSPAYPGGGSSPSTVSPSIQTQISPQISPTFQQTQSSPGSVQAATATQYQPGGQTATTGIPMEPVRSPLPATAPSDYIKPGGLPASSLDPAGLTSAYRFRDAGDFVRDIQTSAPFNFTPIVWIVGIGAVAVIGLTVLKNRGKK